MQRANRRRLLAVAFSVAVSGVCATPARARLVEPDELKTLVEPSLRVALAKRALELAILELDAAAWEIPEPGGESRLRAEVELPVGVASLVALRLNVRLYGPSGNLLSERAVRATVEADASVLLTARSVEPGMRLAENTHPVRRRLTGAISGLLIVDANAAVDALTGLVLRRRLPRGSAVRTADVSRGPEVTAGDSVTAVSGDQQVRVVATALTAGRRGDTIAVRIFSAGAAVPARVVGPRQVELQSVGRAKP